MPQDVFGLSKAKTGRPAPFLLPKKLLRLVVGGWTGGTGSDDMGTSVTNTVAQTTNSYCIADITIEKCSHLEKGLYVGGLTGLVKKPGSSNNFDTFYHKGTLKVQQAPGAAGYLFGDMVKDGIYQQAYYHGPSAAASELTGRLAGNSTFEAGGGGRVPTLSGRSAASVRSVENLHRKRTGSRRVRSQLRHGWGPYHYHQYQDQAAGHG